MTASTSTASAAVDARISLDGDKYCFGKFLDRSTTERVQNHRNAICGTAHPPNHRVIVGREIVEFSLLLDITADIIDTLLPHMTVTNTSGTIWTSNETLTSFDIVVDKVGQIHTYTDCRIARWTFRAQRGSMPVSLQLDCVAVSETETPAATFTAGPIGPIYGFTSCDFEIDPDGLGYDEYQIDRVAIISDLNIFRQWNNQAQLTDALLTNQETLIATSTPYTAGTKDIYWNNKDAVPDSAIRVTFKTQSDADILIFNLPAAKFIPKSPDIPNKMAEIRLNHTWQAHIDTSTTPDTAAFNIDHTNAA